MLPVLHCRLQPLPRRSPCNWLLAELNTLPEMVALLLMFVWWTWWFHQLFPRPLAEAVLLF